MELKRLVGNDGRLVQCTIGTAAITTIPAASWVKIKAKIADPAVASTTISSIDGTTQQITFSGNTTTVAGKYLKFTYQGITYTAKITTGGAGTNATCAGAGLPTIAATAALNFYYDVSAFGTLSVDDFYYNSGTGSITLAGADSCYAVTFTTMADLTSWSFDLSVDEVDTTVLADTVKKYRKGKADASGQLEFMFIKGVSDLPGGVSNYFMDSRTINAAGSVQVATKITQPLYVLGYLDEDTSVAGGGYTMAILMQIEMFSYSLPMQDSTAVKASPKFRLAGNINPAIYRIFI